MGKPPVTVNEVYPERGGGLGYKGYVSTYGVRQNFFVRPIKIMIQSLQILREMITLKIGIVGLGYVGLTLAVAAAARGAEVFGTEINPKIKFALSNNRAIFFEPKLDELIAAHNHKNFHCVNSFDAPERSI